MKIIITGTTGYVGEGVMLACLDNPEHDLICQTTPQFSYQSRKSIFG